MIPMIMSVLYVWAQLNRDTVVSFWFGTRVKVLPHSMVHLFCVMSLIFFLSKSIYLFMNHAIVPRFNCCSLSLLSLFYFSSKGFLFTLGHPGLQLGHPGLVRNSLPFSKYRYPFMFQCRILHANSGMLVSGMCPWKTANPKVHNGCFHSALSSTDVGPVGPTHWGLLLLINCVFEAVLANITWLGASASIIVYPTICGIAYLASQVLSYGTCYWPDNTYRKRFMSRFFQ